MHRSIIQIKKFEILHFYKSHYGNWGIIDWTLHECVELYWFTRKQMTLYKVLHPHADINIPYVTHKRSGRGLLSVADIVCLEKHSLSVYITRSEEVIMANIWDHLLFNGSCDTIKKSSILSKHVDQWRSKALHSQWPNFMGELHADSFVGYRVLTLNQWPNLLQHKTRH